MLRLCFLVCHNRVLTNPLCFRKQVERCLRIALDAALYCIVVWRQGGSRSQSAGVGPMSHNSIADSKPIAFTESSDECRVLTERYESGNEDAGK